MYIILRMDCILCCIWTAAATPHLRHTVSFARGTNLTNSAREFEPDLVPSSSLTLALCSSLSLTTSLTSLP